MALYSTLVLQSCCVDWKPTERRSGHASGGRRPTRTRVLDLDNSVSETYDRQEGTSYNGYFGCECYHLLFLFNQGGDVERALLRLGNVASADDWRSVSAPVTQRYGDLNVRRFFRGDAAFAFTELYELLEAEGYRYAIRLNANAVPERKIRPLLTRPVGRPPNRPQRFYHSFQYQTQSWICLCSVAAKVEWRPGELFPRAGFMVTNFSGRATTVASFYNQRGTAEQWIKEGRNAAKCTWLLYHGFEANQVQLQLHVLAYNLGNFVRRLALLASVKHWMLTTLPGQLATDRLSNFRRVRF